MPGLFFFTCLHTPDVIGLLCSKSSGTQNCMSCSLACSFPGSKADMEGSLFIF